MPDQVKVEDLEVFTLFRAALLKFAQAADRALANADSQIARTHSWLENEQATYWQGQLRKRAEAVTRAREAVRQKKLYKDSSGRTPSAAEEEKILAHCLVAVEQAEQKIQAVRKWRPRLEKEADLYRSGVARLSKTLSDDVPRAAALLERLAVSLDQYLQIETPAAPAPESAAPAPLAESVARGGETEPPAGQAAATPPISPATEKAPPAAPPATHQTAREAHHVAAG